MISLNTKSILQCNEKETEIHFKEIESIFEKLSTDDNFCIVEVSYSDPIQIIDKCRRIIKMKLSELEDSFKVLTSKMVLIFIMTKII